MGKFGYVNEEGVYVVPDKTAEKEIMRTFMFMHDNKNEYLSKNNAERVSSASLPGGARNNRSAGRINENHMFSFRPQIVPKSRNMAENYKRTFADVYFLSNLYFRDSRTCCSLTIACEVQTTPLSRT
jgi:hypothetical protein